MSRNPRCGRRFPGAIALVICLNGCGDPPAYLRHHFPGPPADAEVVAALDEAPPGLQILPDGRWAVREEAAEEPDYPLRGDLLLVPVAGGRFEARIESVLRSPQPRVTEGAGELVAAVAHSETRPGTGLVAVRLGTGWTRTLATWDMNADHGYLDVERMALSPEGRRLALQLVEMHPSGDGFRAVGRRGVIVPLDEGAGERIDLGTEVDGPMAWSPDGQWLYFLRPARGGRSDLLRLSLPAPEPAPEQVALARPPPAESSPSPAPARPGAAASPGGQVEERMPAAYSQTDLIASIVRLSSGEPGERLKAATEMGAMPDPMAVGPLLTAMEKGDSALCLAADGALRSILENHGVAPLSGSSQAPCAATARAWRDWWRSHPGSLRR